MARNPVPHKWTIEAYLLHEEQTGIKHEYVDGDIYAMSGGTENHSLITTNVVIELGQQLRGSSCRVHSSDMRIQISETKYVYPDLSIVCGDAQFADKNHTMLKNPTVIVEVMSSSSADYARGTKWDYYRSLPSLQAYLLLDQSRVLAQLHIQHETGWLLQEFSQHGLSVPLEAIDCSLPLSEVYREIVFED